MFEDEAAMQIDLTAKRLRISSTYRELSLARKVVLSDWRTKVMRSKPTYVARRQTTTSAHSRRSFLIRLILSVMYRLLMNAYTTVLRSIDRPVVLMKN